MVSWPVTNEQRMIVWNQASGGRSASGKLTGDRGLQTIIKVVTLAC
ncbi:MAG: hypothetical protein AB2693_28405 [Candidatus Thiodiazotropha sp.]